MSYAKSMISINFIEYASYVIKDRAIPDINDGLKPVQRRILHSLYEIDDGKFNKVANVIGNTMKYHPHGDASIFSSLVVLANKDYYIDKQGNFGNIFTGDEPSAPRYIECRLTSLAKEVLFNKEITDYIDSYDGRNKEPVNLPAKIPNVLLLGAEGIAVGMSTKILPHNFNEVLNAQIALLKGKKIKLYPDFQQGGIIDISDYQDGNGKVRLRAFIEIPNDKTIVIREIPYGTTTESLIASIESAARKGKIKINSITDYTAEKIEIEIKLSRGENANDTIKALYAYTDCEVSIPVNLIVIVNNKPKQMSVTEVLEYSTNKLMNDLKRELEIEKDKLEQKLHNLTLEQIFIENRIYKKIEELTEYNDIIATVTKAMNNFKKFFIRELTKNDIENLLEIKIKRISKYDIENHKKNIDNIVRQLEIVKTRLKDVKKWTIEYLTDLLKKYGQQFPRKTKIEKLEEISIKEATNYEIKVYWDKKGGFLGTEVKGDTYFTASPFDKFIVFLKNGNYRVISAEGKNFIDTDAIYVDIYDPKRVYSVIYTDSNTKIPYVKKFRVEKFVTNKIYNVSQIENVIINYFTTLPKEKVKIVYVKRPKQKINEEEFDFSKIEIKSSSVKGNKISSKEIDMVIKK